MNPLLAILAQIQLQANSVKTRIDENVFAGHAAGEIAEQINRRLSHFVGVDVHRGGGRNRTGGKWRGVDPIVPFLEPTQLAALQSFYGLPEGCPITSALVSCWGWSWAGRCWQWRRRNMKHGARWTHGCRLYT